GAPVVPPLDLSESIWGVAVHGDVIVTATTYAGIALHQLQRLKGQHLGLYGGWGSRVSPVWARNPSMRAGRYWMRLSRFLTTAASWSTLRTARLPRPFFMFAQAPSAALRSVFRLSQIRMTGACSSLCAAAIRPA